MISNSARAEKWVIAVSEWYPYVCETCAGKGPGISGVRKMLNDVGIEVQFVFLPWARAISDVKRKKYDGYYPAWEEDFTPGMYLSDSVYRSPVGFVERKKSPLKWSKLEDLRGKTIGVVIDYGNTVEFNRLVERGLVKVEKVKDDETNIKKVLGGRVDGAFFDLVNAKYLINKLGPQAQENLQINEHVIRVKSLHVVFASNAKSKAALFNRLLKRSQIQRQIDAYLKAHPPESATLSALL